MVPEYQWNLYNKWSPNISEICSINGPWISVKLAQDMVPEYHCYFQQTTHDAKFSKQWPVPITTYENHYTLSGRIGNAVA